MTFSTAKQFLSYIFSSGQGKTFADYIRTSCQLLVELCYGLQIKLIKTAGYQ